jgi:YD repeat-containing protein
MDGTGLSRVEVWILPTRVEDRFGNFVTYTYDAALPWRLREIRSNDGRALMIAYGASGRIATVSDGTRQWRYTETTQGLDVALPDGSRWVYALNGLRSARIEPEPSRQVFQFCARAGGSAVQPIHTGTITHPSGAIGTFRFQSRTHGRSWVDKVCVKPNPAGL